MADDGHNDNSTTCESQSCFRRNHQLGPPALESQEAVLVCRSPQGERRPCAVLVCPLAGACGAAVVRTLPFFMRPLRLLTPTCSFLQADLTSTFARRDGVSKGMAR